MCRIIDGLTAWEDGWRCAAEDILYLSFSLSQGLHSDGADSLPTYLPTYLPTFLPSTYTRINIASMPAIILPTQTVDLVHQRRRRRTPKNVLRVSHASAHASSGRRVPRRRPW